MTDSLAQCEREVEGARAKLTADLATLRSPATVAAFTDGLKQEALAAKDTAIQHAKDAVLTGFEGLVDDLKGKAAANPAAVLTIGAGIAWQLIRNPPITSALIGAGLFSLWRTQTFGAARRSDSDYLDQGKHRLKQQMSEFGVKAAGMATDVGGAVSEKTAHLYDTALEALQDWSHEAAETAAVAGSALRTRTDGLAASARRTFHDALDQVERGAPHAADNVGTSKSDTVFFVHKTAESAGETTVFESRDTILLGIAGVAMAAAVGIAFQKRIAGNAD